jgi:hypothetical protein
VGGDPDVVEAAQRVVCGHRFGFEDVESGAGDLFVVEGVDEGRLGEHVTGDRFTRCRRDPGNRW